MSMYRIRVPKIIIALNYIIFFNNYKCGRGGIVSGVCACVRGL
jgi:hypothetical protein